MLLTNRTSPDDTSRNKNTPQLKTPVPALDSPAVSPEREATSQQNRILQYPNIDPAALVGTRFSSNEAYDHRSGSGVEAFRLSGLPTNLTYRKLYSWLWIDTTSNPDDYRVSIELQQFRDGTQVGSLPVAALNSSVAVGTAQKTSVASVCVTSLDTPQPDTIYLFPYAIYGTQVASYLLHPHCFVSGCDEIRAIVKELFNVSKIRLWAGVISSFSR